MAQLTVYLLLAIAIVFILQLAVPGFDGLFVFLPTHALGEPWRFLSSVFLHGGFNHLFFNAYALFMFGSVLETQIRPRDYLLLFLLAGIVGSIFYYATYLAGIIGDIPAWGASGAIYGILGAVAVLLPDLRIFFWFFPMRMQHAALLWAAIEFLGTFNADSGVASAAHLGGLFFGLAYAWHLKERMRVQYPPVRDTWGQ